MALGKCSYMACASMLGSSFRARFRLDASEGYVDHESELMTGHRPPVVCDSEPTWRDLEVLLCPKHEREVKELREQWPARLMVTREGHVYSGLWMDSLGFMVK